MLFYEEESVQHLLCNLPALQRWRWRKEEMSWQTHFSKCGVPYWHFVNESPGFFLSFANNKRKLYSKRLSLSYFKRAPLRPIMVRCIIKPNLKWICIPFQKKPKGRFIKRTSLNHSKSRKLYIHRNFSLRVRRFR